MELTVFDPGATWIKADIICTGYDDVRYLISEDGTMSDPEQVFEMAEDAGINHGGAGYDVYRFEKQGLEPLTRYKVYAVGKFEKSGTYHMEKGSTVTLPMSLRVTVNSVTEESIWARAQFEGYEEVKFYLSEDAGITDVKWLLEHGEAPNGPGSDNVSTYHFTDLDLDYDKTYTIYCAASYGDEYYDFATTQVKTAGLDPKVYCGAMSSYSYYQDGLLSTANEMCNTAIAIAGLMVSSDKTLWPAYACSTYEGIWDKDIESAGVVVYIPVTLSLSQSTEHAGDYSENGEQVHMIRLDLHFLKRISATSAPVMLTNEYPCFQIEHESALPLTHTLVEDLRIFYAE